ncbi:MAG: hypothetical protein EOO14_23875 [Chitinophagaceae bacterium]|nr:MAG: hypothetical protein EOO14_23875 [Chitinophagaceae bacterium]
MKQPYRLPVHMEQQAAFACCFISYGFTAPDVIEKAVAKMLYEDKIGHKNNFDFTRFLLTMLVAVASPVTRL